ncbi:MAG: hypothetical protein GY742_06580 [Hyphomicrobiales bacterium]|nr:hypothetical protein [Hyphomicrobiales bacterium]
MAMGRKGRDKLRKTPFSNEFLIRVLLANRQDFRAQLDDEGILLIPKLPEEVGFMDWQHSSLLMNCAQEWADTEISNLQKKGNLVLATIDDINSRYGS